MEHKWDYENKEWVRQRINSFDAEQANLGVPMISPHLIPDGYDQTWDAWKGEWVLVRLRPAPKYPRTVETAFEITHFLSPTLIYQYDKPSPHARSDWEMMEW